jgi:GT2 family glycosyltransferase
MKIAAVLVNYNGSADTVECLHSLKQQTNVNCDFIVVDNASPNDTPERITQAHPDAHMLNMERNLGFSGGNNVGIRYALARGYNYIFLVNNDTIVEQDCLSHLVDCAVSDKNAGIVAPAMYHYPLQGSPWFTGSRISMTKGTVEHEMTDLKALGIVDPFTVPWITGCAMLIPRAILDELGSFDERFFCYYEDVDLSLRFREAGHSLIICPRAILYHKVSSAVGTESLFQVYYSIRNSMLFFSKHTREPLRPILLSRLTRRAILPALKELRIGRNAGLTMRSKTALRAKIDFYKGRFGMQPLPV